ncbi:hypothetical protein GCM10023205_26290 [Yinghuangia aomiensis]|uniref:Lipoprotein n=1 Tax=Yinghuangia aomiensis TaxID=676205 RepID=A0ABP9H466_9ACTN
MRYRNLVALAATAFLLAGCGGGGGDDKSETNQPTATGQTAGGVGAEGSSGPEQAPPAQEAALPKAVSFEEVAALLKPSLGPCQRMETDGTFAKLTAADKARGGKQKALCWYQEQQYSVAFLLVDQDNTTLETFHKDKDTYSSERVGMGFTVAVVGTANAQVKAAAEQQLKATGLPFLNCEKDFAPRDGVQIIAAKTPGCRYTPTPRI